MENHYSYCNNEDATFPRFLIEFAQFVQIIIGIRKMEESLRENESLRNRRKVKFLEKRKNKLTIQRIEEKNKES